MRYNYSGCTISSNSGVTINGDFLLEPPSNFQSTGNDFDKKASAVAQLLLICGGKPKILSKDFLRYSLVKGSKSNCYT